MTPWDEFAVNTLPDGPLQPFSWTPYPGHGPGLELLGLKAGSAVLELGCGRGDRLVHCVEAGHRAVGVDASTVQIAAAGWWGRLGLRLHHADAAHYLLNTTDLFDAVFSVFGAHWFTDPAVLLPRIRARLREGGMVALAHMPPEEDGGGRVYASPPNGRSVVRWEGGASDWAYALNHAGFKRPAVTMVEPPYGSGGVHTAVLTAWG